MDTAEMLDFNTQSMPFEIVKPDALVSHLQEFKRFLVLYDRLVNETYQWMEATPEDKLNWLPIDTPYVRFGDRLTEVTIKTLYIHMAMAEYKWIPNLMTCAEGDTIALPRDAELMRKLVEGDTLEEGRKMHQQNMAHLAEYTDEILSKKVSFAGDGSQWSGMGFLWGMYGHRSYHLGNLDIYLRQSDTPTPDFYSFQPKTMA